MTFAPPTQPYAKVIAHSRFHDTMETVQRFKVPDLFTFEVRMHRFVLAEFNTHRVFSRNSASSRAIPVEKQLAKLIEDPAWPLEWPSEQPGMQGGVPLEGDDLVRAQEMFEQAHKFISRLVSAYLAEHPAKPSRLHKSLVNRLLEPFMWHTVVVTATAWENFFRQRVSALAQPEIREAATLMFNLAEESTPKLKQVGEWHLPYTTAEDDEWAFAQLDHGRTSAITEDRLEMRRAMDTALVPISSARSARVSYLTQDGKRDHIEDLRLYRGDEERKGLITNEPMHASPLEHVATPAPWNIHTVALSLDEATGLVIPIANAPGCTKTKTLRLPIVGNFLGWQQHRLAVEMSKDYAFYA